MYERIDVLPSGASSQPEPAVDEHGVYRDSEGAMLTANAAERRHGVKRGRLRYWQSYPCPHLHGAKLRARLVAVTPAAQRKRVWVYDEKQVEQIALASTPAADQVYRDAAGDWLPTRVAVERFVLNRCTLADWRKKPTPRLGGRTIRAKRIRLVSQRGFLRKVWVYHTADLDCAAEKQPVPVLAPALSDGACLPTWIIKKRYGIGSKDLRRYRRSGCEYLGGRKLPVEMRRVRTASGRSSTVPCYPEDDIKKIADARRTRPADCYEDQQGRWFPARTAADLFKLPYGSLYYWHTRGCAALEGAKLRAQQAVLPIPGPQRRFRRVRVYCGEDLQTIVRSNGGAMPSDRKLRQMVVHHRSCQTNDAEPNGKASVSAAEPPKPNGKVNGSAAERPTPTDNVPGPPAAGQSTGNKGGRPRQWDKLWAMIQQADGRDPKPMGQDIANEFNRHYGRPIGEGKMKRATASIVAKVRNNYSDRPTKETTVGESQN